MIDKSVLYIEDNPDNAGLVARIVESIGVQFWLATNGTEGLRLVDQIRPTVILLDINLPDIDGYEVARRLRASTFYKNEPIIAITANAQQGDGQKALDAGCTGYITKPISIQDVRKRILAALGN